VNRELVSEALAIRAKVVIVTKVGFAYDENGDQAGLSILV
jgi:hypothetical protein